jgi:hypothetical protein
LTIRKEASLLITFKRSKRLHQIMVEITKNKPVFEYFLKAVQEITKPGSQGTVHIYTSMQPTAIGLAVDTGRVLAKVYPHLGVELQLPYKPSITFKSHQRGIYNLVIAACGRQFDETLDGDYVTTTRLEHELALTAPFVATAKRTVPKFSNKPKSSLEIAILNNGFELPEEKQRITIHVAHQGVTSLPIDTYYQAFDPLEEYPKGSAGFFWQNYPLAESARRGIDGRTYAFLHEPLRAHYWAVKVVSAMQVLTGNKTYSELSADKTMNLETLLKSREQSETLALEILKYLARGLDTSKPVMEIGVGEMYLPLFWPKVNKTIHKIFGGLNGNSRLVIDNLMNNCDDLGIRVRREELERLPLLA